MRSFIAAIVLLLLSTPVQAQSFPKPPVVDVEEHLGRQLPLDLTFTDQDGHQVVLGDELSTSIPTLLIFAYYECPMLCGLVLKGTATSIQHLDWKIGDRFRVLTVSIDPKDGPANADRKQRNVLHELGYDSHKADWPFLVGKQDAITALADAVGFKYTYDERSKQYLHPAALIVLAPGGRISRYLYGVDFPVRDLKLALIEASDGKSGASFDRFILTCFHYDPTTRRYGPYVFGFLRLGSSLVALALGLAIFRMRRREKEETRR